jgi:hypothetical protein
MLILHQRQRFERAQNASFKHGFQLAYHRSIITSARHCRISPAPMHRFGPG